MQKRNDTQLTFLTWNIYLGADLTPVIGGLTPQGVSTVFRQFLATNFPVRVKAIASEIVRNKPDLIGLQEAEKWVLTIPDVQTVTYDFVQMLLNELKERGLDYEVAVQNENQSVPPTLDSHGNFISFLDRDVILIRKEKRLKVIHTQASEFSAKLVIGPFEIVHGWSLVDVKLDEQVFRMINTHLEPFNEGIRNAQAMELLTVPANTNLPVIITGDLNSLPGSEVYQMFIEAGFHDVWQKVGEGNGFTCCQDSDVLNAVSSLNRRIDYIWFKNGWKPLEARLVGQSQSDRTKTGLWPSDHAGVSAKLKLDDNHDHHHGHESSD